MKKDAGTSMIDSSVARMRRRIPPQTWFGIIILISLILLVTILYVISFQRITVFDAGRGQEVRTQETIVEDVLRDAGISLRAEDIVSPPLDSTIRSGETITIRRAQLVRLMLAGESPRLVRTQRESARDLLRDVGYTLGNDDGLRIDGEFGDALPIVKPAPTAMGSQFTATAATHDVPVADVEVLRAVPVVIEESGRPSMTIRTIARTVGEALLQAGNIMFMADRVEPSLGTHVTEGMTITITRAKLVTVWVDGVPVQTRTHAKTVAEMLNAMKIMLLEKDHTRPDLDAPIDDGSEVRIVRVTRELQIRREPIEFETYWEPNADLELDTETLAQEGAPGIRELRDHVVLEDGQEFDRRQVVDLVVEPVKHRIYNYGTQIVVRDLPTPSGNLQYWRKIRALATSYSASTSGVSRSVSWYGKARCGETMRRGIVAVDPRVIPLGTMIYVEGYGVGLACDTGSAVIGKRIDLGYGDNDLEHWYRYVDVYVLTPVPLNPRYRLE
jgi:uncharacterized protein YabE (DUF348 family)